MISNFECHPRKLSLQIISDFYIISNENMYAQKERKTPRLAIWSLIAVGTAVVLIFTLTPWNFIPTEVTEEVTVLAVTEHGCVGQSQYGISVVIPQCEAQIGSTVSATFYVPSMELNGYYDQIQNRVEMVNP